MNNKCIWIKNSFIDQNLYAPFKIEKDIDYFNNLKEKYKMLLNNAVLSKADDESIRIIENNTKKVLKAIKLYYNGEISKSHSIIKKLVKDCKNHHFAVSKISNSDAFPGVKGSELQFFRARVSNKSENFKAIDMLHLPKTLRGKTGNYRFSIPGMPSLYLGNSSYVCWLESGKPSEHDFHVSPVLVDDTLQILNLAVMTRDWTCLNDLKKDTVHCWIKLLILMIATSYVIVEENRTFKSEYIISQSIMLACKELGLDGIAYYSKRIDDEIFGVCAINLALFAPYDKNNYSSLCNHIKIDDSYNYAMFKQLYPSQTYQSYDMRITRTGLITNIGNYRRQHPYNETYFFNFDNFLYTSWKDKDEAQWGNALKNIK